MSDPPRRRILRLNARRAVGAPDAIASPQNVAAIGTLEAICKTPFNKAIGGVMTPSYIEVNCTIRVYANDESHAIDMNAISQLVGRQVALVGPIAPTRRRTL